MSRAELLVLRAGDERVLREWTRASSIPAGLAQRARILLLAAEGHSNTEIGRLVGVSLPTVRLWRGRYGTGGVGARGDLHRSGRPAIHDDTAIIAVTLDPPPAKLGVTHWSARLLADHRDISFATVARIWRRWGYSRGRPRRSSSPPSPSSRPRSTTSWACTWTRPRKRSWSASTRRPRSRRSTAPPRSCRSAPGCPRSRRPTTRGTAPQRCSPGWRSRPAGHRPLLSAAHERRVPLIPEAGHPCLPAGSVARALRQLRDPQAPQRDGLADQAPTGAAALHPDQRELAEHGGDLLWDHHPSGDSPRHVPQRQGPRDRHRHLHRRLERTRSPIHLDQGRRRDHRPRQTVTPPEEDLRPATLVGLLPVGVVVDLLVRGLPDARKLASTSRLRSGVTVYCGGLDRFDTEGPYDLIVALGAPSDLLTPDSVGLGHSELLRKLAGWLSADGTLMASVDNELGFDKQFRMRIRDAYDGDGMWYRGAPGFEDRALYYRELGGALESANLVPDFVYAAFPAAGSLSMLIGSNTVDDPAVASTAAALTARMEQSHFSDQPSLLNVYDMSLRLFEGGLTMQFAPAWIVVARPAEAATSSDTDREALPALLASEDTGRSEWRALTTVQQQDGRWTHQARAVSALTEMRERRILRDYGELPVQVPEGPTLEALLRRACATGSIGPVRRLVQSYAAWLGDSEVWPAGSAGGRLFAVPSNVVVTESGLVCFDDSWRWTAHLDADIVIVRGLRDFARRLLRSGAEHPWTPDISPDALTQTLAAMAGVEWFSHLVAVVARIEAELTTVVHGGDASYEARAYASDMEGGASQYASSGGALRGYREALASSGRLAQALYEREGQVTWLEATLRARDIRVGDMNATLAAIRGSVSFRIGRVLTWPLRATVLAVRRVALSVILARLPQPRKVVASSPVARNRAILAELEAWCPPLDRRLHRCAEAALVLS